jgi:hypothetical protein
MAQLIRELMIPYNYPQILKYLNKTYSVFKKSESTFFALKIAKMTEIKNEPSWEKIALLSFDVALTTTDTRIIE